MLKILDFELDLMSFEVLNCLTFDILNSIRLWGLNLILDWIWFLNFFEPFWAFFEFKVHENFRFLKFLENETSSFETVSGRDIRSRE